eukprot:TRINITY_DN8977_c0_g2_i1.p1 TRINITY_DN8977_c0_g2~~TRINITY_DN8977_c0_g2_i1.p1  ORF type:complete len:696 (+),score=126.54 TRINITY_DN8977_c0_g2_i1:74-2161(+)
MIFQEIEQACAVRGLNTRLAYSLWQFYKSRNPSKLPTIPEIIEEWDGAEEDLMKALHQKYNVREKEKALLEEVMAADVLGNGRYVKGERNIDKTAAEAEGRESGEAVVEKIKRNAKKRVAEKLTSGSPLLLPEPVKDMSPLRERRPAVSPPPLGPPSPLAPVPTYVPMAAPPAMQPPLLGTEPIAALPRQAYHIKPRTPRHVPTPIPVPAPAPSQNSFVTQSHRTPTHSGNVELERSMQELEDAVDMMQGKQDPTCQALDDIEKIINGLERKKPHSQPLPPQSASTAHLPIVDTRQEQRLSRPAPSTESNNAEDRYQALRADLEGYQQRVMSMLNGEVTAAPPPSEHPSSVVPSMQPSVPVQPSVSAYGMAVPEAAPQMSTLQHPSVPEVSFAKHAPATVWVMTQGGPIVQRDFGVTFHSDKVYLIEAGRPLEVWLWIGRHASQNDANLGFSEVCTRSDARGAKTTLHRVFSEAEGRGFEKLFPFSVVLTGGVLDGVEIRVLQVNMLGDGNAQLCEVPVCLESVEDTPCIVVEDGVRAGLLCRDEGKRRFCERVLKGFTTAQGLACGAVGTARLGSGNPAQRQHLDARLVARLGLSLRAPSKMVSVHHLTPTSFRFKEVPFQRKSLSSSLVFLIFHQRAVTVWAGSSIPLGPVARGLHVSTVDTYIAENNLPPDLPISLIIEGSEPQDFDFMFIM